MHQYYYRNQQRSHKINNLKQPKRNHQHPINKHQTINKQSKTQNSQTNITQKRYQSITKKTKYK